MPKNAKLAANPANKKKAKLTNTEAPKKVSKTNVDMDAYNEKKIGWNFSKMDSEGRWPCTFRRLTPYRETLLTFEGKRIEEILNMRHCHPIGCDSVCEKAQNRLNFLDISGQIFQLDIGGPARLWGILDSNIFHLMWIDPEHEVYPSQR